MGRLLLAMIARAFGVHEAHKIPTSIVLIIGPIFVTGTLFACACNSVWKRKLGLKKTSFLRVFFEYILVIAAVVVIVPPYTFLEFFLRHGNDEAPTPTLLRVIVPLVGLIIFAAISRKKTVAQKRERESK